MKTKDILGLGNCLTDIVINVEENEIKEIGLKKGTACLSSACNINSFEKIIESREKIYVPGGSPSNTIANASYLGAECGLIGAVGDDEMGKRYKDDLKLNRVRNYLAEISGKSGCCHILITPDKERTMVADTGVSGKFEIPFPVFHQYKIFHTSAYELENNKEKTLEALEFAADLEMQISFDIADSFLVEKRKKEIINALEYVNIVFSNEKEAKALTGAEPEKALHELNDICDIAIIKLGEKGSIIKSKGSNKIIEIDPHKTSVVNTNGAGDAYASGFLLDYLLGNPLEDCGRYGSYISSKICRKEGARLSE